MGRPGLGLSGDSLPERCHHLGWADAGAPREWGEGRPAVRGWHRLLSLPVHARLLALPATPATRACALEIRASRLPCALGARV